MARRWTHPRTWVAGDTLTADELNTHVRDNLDYLGGSRGWENIGIYNTSGLVGPWSQWGGWPAPQVIRIGPMVYMRGAVKSGTSALITRVPDEYQPGYMHTFLTPAAIGAGAAVILIYPHSAYSPGDVLLNGYVSGGTSNFVSLNASWLAWDA